MDGWVDGDVYPSSLPDCFKDGHEQKYLKQFWLSFCQVATRPLVWQNAKQGIRKSVKCWKVLLLSNRMNALCYLPRCWQSCWQWRRIHVLPLFISGLGHICFRSGLPPVWPQAITSTNADSLSIEWWGRQWNLGNDTTSFKNIAIWHGPLTRYAKLWVAHAPGMPETFSQPPTSNETTS